MRVAAQMSYGLDTMATVPRRRRPPYRENGGRGLDSKFRIPPTVVLFSSDPAVLALAERALLMGWKLEHCDQFEVCRKVLSQPDVRVVIVDDEAIAREARGLLLERVRRFVPHALLIYVAGAHSAGDERRARSHAAQYYTAKPLDPDRTHRVLESFLRAAAEPDGHSAERARLR